MNDAMNWKGRTAALTPPQTPRMTKTESTAEIALDACPKCNIPLTDPDGLGLCSACGYCRSLASAKAGAFAPTSKLKAPRWVKALGLVEFWQLMRIAPAWLWVFCAATLAVIPTSLLADHRLPQWSRERAHFSAGELGVGLLLLIVGQVWSVSMLKQLKEAVEYGDMLHPMRLISIALRRLPDTRWPLTLTGSGLSAMLAAVFWVGGLGWWFYAEVNEDGEPDPAVKQAEIASERQREFQRELQRIKTGQELALRGGRAAIPARPNGGGGNGPGAGDAFGPGGKARPGPVNNGGKANPNPAANAAGGGALDPRPTEKCVVIGYVKDEAGKVTGLVVAALREGKLKYAGVVQKGLDAAESQSLIGKLAGMVDARPLLDGIDVKAVWVKPELFCEIHRSGFDLKGQLIDPFFKGLIED
jgi:hypothetical protein